MKILKRGNIVIIDSNLKENIATYEADKAYIKGDRVLFERYIYEALKDNSTSPNSDESAWQKVSISNEYACFDYYLNTISKAQNELDLTFKCVGARGIYLHALRAKYLKIELLDQMSGEIIESKDFALWNSNTKSWSEYFFNDYSIKDRTYNVFYECQTLLRTRIFRIRAWGLSEIELGSIICGNIKELALTLYDKNSISMLDFSKVMTDEDGNTQLVKGNYKRTNVFELLVENKDLDYVAYELVQLRAEACVFIISDRYDCLINFAFLKNHEILLSKPHKSIVSIEIEGLV